MRKSPQARRLSDSAALPPPQRRWLLVPLLLALAVSAVSADTATAGPDSRPSFEASDGDALLPGFRPSVGTYAARCGNDGLALRFRDRKGWMVKAGGRTVPGGKHSFALTSNEAIRISFRKRGARASRFYVRCLPEDFPEYGYERKRSGGPKLFAVQMANTYAAIFSRDGAPIWWYKASGHPDNVEVLEDGTVAWNPVDQATYEVGNYQIRTLTGRLLETITSADGGEVDVHDLQYLPNGNHVIGTHVFRPGVDATSHGGVADARIRDMEIQELTPDGRLVRSWDSGDHISLDETPQRWWETLTDGDSGSTYDVSHWNAVEIVGNYMYLSFRHLDAVYKVNRRTGRIVWKLGGTETSKSLRVLGDPRGAYPLGGQHDIRVLDDGTITIFDNATQLGEAPRGVRYRINEEEGTARLLEELADPKVGLSSCCGSFRATDDGWLVGWGFNGNPSYVGAYDDDGDPIFRITFPTGATYRANPVSRDYVTVERLRGAMDRMARR